jgi:hypothetical protein
MGIAFRRSASGDCSGNDQFFHGRPPKKFIISKPSSRA